MKTFFAFLLAATFFAACSTTGSMSDAHLSGPEYFSRFSHLADALKIDPALIVTGSGANAQVKLRKSGSVTNQEPLYVINGMSIGNSYRMADQAINMANVTSIRVLKNASDLTTYGHMGANGVIVIRTAQNTNPGLTSAGG